MGAGKSTIGRKAARNLNKPFIDTDAFIEDRYGHTISEIIKTSGQAEFRIIEKKVLEELTSLENYIIATGGGMPCHNNNIDTINSNGLSLYLQYTPGELFKRLQTAKKERPLLKGMTKEVLLAYVRDTLSEREYFYRQAHYMLNGKRLKIAYVTSFISKILT